MSKYFIPSQGPDSWKYSLVDREKQWKEGYSAYELAHCWEYAKELPECVRTVFEDSGIPLFQNVEILFGFPEYKVSLPGGSTSSQNDLYVLAKANNELLTIMIEGKVSETFGKRFKLGWGFAK